MQEEEGKSRMWQREQTVEVRSAEEQRQIFARQRRREIANGSVFGGDFWTFPVHVGCCLPFYLLRQKNELLPTIHIHSILFVDMTHGLLR